MNRSELQRYLDQASASYTMPIPQLRSRPPVPKPQKRPSDRYVPPRNFRQMSRKEIHSDYMGSKFWRVTQRKKFVAIANNRCALTGVPIECYATGPLLFPKWILTKWLPWLILKGGQGRRPAILRRWWGCHIHHTWYSSSKDGKPNYMGQERYGADILAVSPWAHTFFHLILGGNSAAGRQCWGSFPNIAQKLAHTWARLPHFFRFGMMLGVPIYFYFS